MIQTHSKQLQKTSQRFQKQKNKLPADIAWKLQYMLDYINNKAKPISQLSQQQKNQVKDLQDMTPHALKYVFISIVNSILNPNLYCSFEKNCRMKVDGIITRWIKVYVSFTENQICFTNRKKIFKFVLEELECVKVSDRQLEFKYRGVRKSKIRFDHKQAAVNMQSKINEMISEYKKNKKQINQQQAIIQNKIFLQSLKNDYVVSYHNKSKQNRFLTHKKLSKIHVSMFMKGQFWNVYQLMQFLIRQTFWNSKAIDQKFLQYSGNKVLIQRRLRSSSFFSLQRRTFTQFKIYQINQNCFVIEQKSYPGQPSSKSIILSEIYIKTVLDVLSPKIIKITMDCTFNAKGYCNTSSSRSMLIDLFNDYVFLQERYVKLKQKNKLHYRFFLKDLVEKKSVIHQNKQLDDVLPLNSKLQNIEEQNKESNKSNQQQQEFYSVSDNIKYFISQEQKSNDENNEFYGDQFFAVSDQNDMEQQSFNDQVINDSNFKKSISKEKQPKKQQVIQNKSKLNLNILQQFKKHKPQNYDKKIHPQYVKLIKEKAYEKVYLHQKFLQSQKANYMWETPWYDPSIIIPNGHQYNVSDKNQLIFINYQLIQGQKDSLIFVIKQVGANIISGKSVLNVSLPVDIFQSRSLLQRSCASFGCAPKYLKPCADLDVNSQMKAVIGFMLSVAPLQLIMLKPFNPILGQTFQAYLGGVPIYYQQISHHPPISSYYMVCDEFTLYGNLVAVANVGLNSGSGGNSGKMYIKMRNGSHFQVSFFSGQISGLIYGKRKYSVCNKAYVFERKSHLVAEISSNKQSKGIYEWKSLNKQPTLGDIIGGIFKVKQKFLKQNPPNKSLMYFGGLKKQDIQQKIQMVNGLWFSNVKIGSEIINKDITAFPVQYSQTLLPSDSNYRMDILMHRFGDLARSQSQKQALQKIQRNDKKLRQAKQSPSQKTKR